MVSNPPHTVKFHDAEFFNHSKFQYGIVHDYINRDAMPDKEVWNLALRGEDFLNSSPSYSKKIKTKEEKYEYNLAIKKITELQNYFGGIDIDAHWENWGYDEKRNLVIFDLDGNVSRPKYEKFMKRFS